MKAQKRGRNIALAGAALQVIFTVTMLAIGLRTGAEAPVACSWFLAGGVLVWLMAALLFYCRQLEEQEATELEELAARGEQGGIFDRGRDLSLRPARARRVFVERWVVPVFTLLLAAYHATIGVLVLMALRSLLGQETIPPMAEDTAAGLLFGIVTGFAAFLFSRYSTGMAGRIEWRPLRAPAAQLLVAALMIAGVVAGFVANWWGYRIVDVVVAFAVVVLQFVLAAELVVSFILDLYRPRVPGEERRLSFDSRIFNLLAEPAKVGRSIAETLNYQFGFEVSKTWFYRLLSKSLLPLVVFGAAALVLLTSVVIVYEGRKCVVLRWGRREWGRPSTRRLLGPGVHLKWPWPIDTARHFDVGKVHELRVGVGEQRTPTVIKGRELELWTDPHGRYRELDFLLAIPPERAGGRVGQAATQAADLAQEKEAPPPVNIIKLVVSVFYRIDDPYKFGYDFVDGAKLLESAAYREMVRYCASATLHAKVGDGDTDRPEAIMTSGWGKASAALEKRIRQEVGPGGLDLGVKIHSVKLIAVHPPPEAAEAFEAVLAAERAQDQARYQAEGQVNRILSAVAGDPDSALELALAVMQVEQLGNLATVRADPADFDRYLRGYVLNACANLKILMREVRREALLGKLPRTARPTTHSARRPVDYPAALRAYVPQVDQDVRALLDELLRDGFLEALGGPGGTAKQRLAARHVQRLLQLLEVRAKREKFDFGAALAAANLRADALFARAVGEPAQKVAEANSDRLRYEMGERARAEAFRKELLAYRANPELYAYDRWLDVWDEVLPGMVKYVLGVDRDRIEIRMNWERQRTVLPDFPSKGEEQSP